jgi:hypothetical protein
MSDSSYQLQYWNLLKELKVHVIYLHLYISKDEKVDRIIDIFLAILSSTSIAAWAVWQQYPMVWAGLIAVSQIITAIKPFLPYKTRIKLLSELNDQIQILSLECEKGWFDVSEGVLTNREIHAKRMEFKNKTAKAERTVLNSTTFPKNDRLLKMAEQEADKYFSSNF